MLRDIDSCDRQCDHRSMSVGEKYRGRERVLDLDDDWQRWSVRHRKVEIRKWAANELLRRRSKELVDSRLSASEQVRSLAVMRQILQSGKPSRWATRAPAEGPARTKSQLGLSRQRVSPRGRLVALLDWRDVFGLGRRLTVGEFALISIHAKIDLDVCATLLPTQVFQKAKHAMKAALRDYGMKPVPLADWQTKENGEKVLVDETPRNIRAEPKRNPQIRR